MMRKLFLPPRPSRAVLHIAKFNWYICEYFGTSAFENFCLISAYKPNIINKTSACRKSVTTYILIMSQCSRVYFLFDCCNPSPFSQFSCIKLETLHEILFTGRIAFKRISCCCLECTVHSAYAIYPLRNVRIRLLKNWPNNLEMESILFALLMQMMRMYVARSYVQSCIQAYGFIDVVAIDLTHDFCVQFWRTICILIIVDILKNMSSVSWQHFKARKKESI